MPDFNINFILIIVGFILLLTGFNLNEDPTIDLQVLDSYVVMQKALSVRLLGIIIVLNGLVYSLFDKLNIRFNIRYKYFGITLFFLSLFIVLSGIIFFGQSNGLEGGVLLSLNNNTLVTMIIFSAAITLFFSLLVPFIIWIKITLKNVFLKR